jgi:hypothetical protein
MPNQDRRRGGMRRGRLVAERRKGRWREERAKESEIGTGKRSEEGRR